MRALFLAGSLSWDEPLMQAAAISRWARGSWGASSSALFAKSSASSNFLFFRLSCAFLTAFSYSLSPLRYFAGHLRQTAL